MSQLLSEARKDYDAGVRYINASRRTEGLAKFNDARQKTREVKLMFPVNQEAGMLDLRMDQVTDPAAFNESFARRLNEAVTGTKRRSIEAFAELQNLAEINPRYAGLAAILTQAEIDMGIRQPPPDPRALARSAELTVSAQRILDGNVRAQFEVALAQLNEAIILNPNNTQAPVLKDRVQTELGGGTNFVMDSDTLRRYNEAVMELQRGNNFVALSIVQQLLQNPKNQRINQILELQRRIQSLL
jgi:tetratricopeptide (TPR) repeat protein